MKRYFGYIRVSDPRQDRGVSPDVQRAAIAAFAARQKWTIEEWFLEKKTAAKQGRAIFTAMLAKLKRGDVDGVIFHKVDRSARNLGDWHRVVMLLDQGVDVQFAHDTIDLHTRGGRLTADIQAVVAADFIRNHREEVKKGFYGRLAQGIYPLQAPTGYLNCGGGRPKTIDPISGPLVRFAFERYATGEVGLNKLQTELAERGLRTRRQKTLAVSGLAKMLRCRFYIGLMHIKKINETFVGVHEPLITKQLFDRVQAVLDGRSVPRATVHDFKYRIMIRHADCSRYLVGERHKGQYVYYRCHGRTCGGVSLNENILDGAAAKAFCAIVRTPEDMDELRELVERERATSSDEGAKHAASLKLRLAQCDDRLSRLTDALIDCRLDKEAFDVRKERLLGEKRGLLDQLEGMNGEPPWLKLYREFELKNSQLLRHETLLDAELREIVDSICSNFSVVGKEPTITLHSPYREVAELARNDLGGPHRGDVRTIAEEILSILRAVAAREAGNDNSSTNQRAA
jgi:site-specific DNA recombinase